MAAHNIDALVVDDDGNLAANLGPISDLAGKNRLASSGIVELAQAGGLLGYGVNFNAVYKHAATFIDKILKGAMPGDLPVEQATNFEFAVNLKTAKAIGVTLPTSILLRADEVIE
jgi:putative ABC transport system substrate-binding protein